MGVRRSIRRRVILGFVFERWGGEALGMTGSKEGVASYIVLASGLNDFSD